jgi:hypothetical protein
MSEPKRLRDSAGAAGVLMGGANALRVPPGARRRALAFTGAAAGIAASTGVAAASTVSLVKTFVLCVCVGAAGGGVMSLAASETASRLQAPSVTPRGEPARRAPAPPIAFAPVPALGPTAQPPTEAVIEPAAPTPEAPPGELDAKPLSRSKPIAAGESSAPPSRVEPPGTSLFEEQRFIESARAAVARGDARAALSELDAYDRAFARKQFGPEALALRVEALRGNGQLTAARALAESFARFYPNHPLLSRVQAAVQR